MLKGINNFILLLTLILFIIASCGRDEPTKPEDKSILGKWIFVSGVVNNNQTINIDKTVFIIFSENQVEFFAEDWTENRGLSDDRAKGLYVESNEKISISWNSSEDEEAANDWLGHCGGDYSNQSQLKHSFKANDLIIEVSVEGDNVKYKCVR